MDRLRRESSLEDAAIAMRILRQQDRILLKRTPDFPDQVSRVEAAPFYSVAPLQIELAQQGLRLADRADDLIAATSRLAEINAAILSGDSERTSRAFSSFREFHGISFLVAQKAITLRHSGGDGERQKRRAEHGEVVAPFLAPRRQVVAVAFEDSIDRERDYLRVRRTFLKFVAADQLDRSDASIIADFFAPQLSSEQAIAQRLQAYGRWGLVDALAYLFRARQVLELGGDQGGVDMIDAIIPADVASVWKGTFAAVDVERLHRLLGGYDQFSERRLFISLPGWSEYPGLMRYRLSVERAVGARMDGGTGVSNGEAARLAPPKGSVQELLANGPRKLLLEEIAPRSSGAFHRTISLISSLEAAGLEEMSGEELSALLDQTVDLAVLLSPEELAVLMPRRPGDPLHSFLRAAVLRDFEEGKVTDHALRRSLQDVVGKRFGGDIVGLLNHVDSENHHVSGHLYRMCSESFLTELYDIYEETDQVTEAHAAILEWWGSRTDDDDAKLLARSHRLTLRLRKVRGAIEETRIYVDPLRFLAWMQEHVGGELRTLSLQADLILSDTDRAVNLRDRVRLAVNPRLKLLALLDRCYEEFCTNKLYGVTSFIGRRIRHGTLHGHLVLETKPMIAAAITEFRHCAPEFAEYLASWMQRFDTAVLNMAAEEIHVRSHEKSRGLINATLDEPAKHRVANRMVEEVAKAIADRPQIIQSAALVHEYCWLLFESDLVRTREAVEKLRRSFIITLDEHRCDRPELDRRIADCIRSINATMQQRFEVVRSWFTRPSNQTPSASVVLLFEAVLDEVRQRFPDFRPRLDYAGARDIDLIGHRFHFFYDALYLLVGNAAKHGHRSGILAMEIDSRMDDDLYTYVSVSIRSDFKDDSREQDLARIEKAMTDQLGDAIMKNQESGLRKLREMVADVEEIVGLRYRVDGDTVIFTIDTRFVRN